MDDLLIYVNSILDYTFLNNDLKNFLSAFLLFVLFYIVIKNFKNIFVKKLKNLMAKTKNNFDDYVIKALEQISDWFYFIVSFYIVSQFLVLPSFLSLFIKGVFIISVVYQFIQFVTIIFDYFLQKIASKNFDDKPYSETTFYGVKLIFKLILWVTGCLLVLSNLGFNINSLIASLGIGGIAVALALQNILSDIFSSFSIYFDRPFEVGDFVVLGADSGTVQKIGLKTTRIKTLQGQELVVSNQELTTARVQNFKRMNKRRIVFNFGLKYETSPEKIEKVTEIVKDLIEKDKNLEFSRVHFSEFGEFSLKFECVYFVVSSSYEVFMNSKQKLNLDVMRAFKKADIEFAYFDNVMQRVNQEEV